MTAPFSLPRLAGLLAALAVLCWAGWGLAETYRELEVRGDALYEKGDYRGALELYGAALELRRPEPEDLETARLVVSVGAAHYGLGEFAEAGAAFRRNLGIEERLRPPGGVEIAHALMHVGMAELRLGKAWDALDPFVRALVVYEKAGPAHRTDADWAWARSAEAQFALGHTRVALFSLERALEELEAGLGPTDPQTAKVRHGLGKVLDGLGRPEEALAAYQAAQAVLEKVYGPDHFAVAQLYADMSRAYQKFATSDHARSLEYAGRSVRAFFAGQRMAFGVLDNAGRVRYNGAARENFQNYFQEVMIERYAHPEESAPLVAEALETWLSYKGSAFAFENGLSLLLARAEPELKGRLETYLARRRELAERSTAVPLTAAETRANGERLAALRGEVARLETELAGRAGPLQGLLAPRGVTLEDLRSVLREGEVYLDYIWSANSLFAFAYRWDGRLDLQWLPLAGRYEPNFEALRRGAEAGESLGQLTPQTRALHDALLGSIQRVGAFEGARSLVISPDGPLHFLPFELLYDGEETLLQRFTLRYVPSARDLVRLRRTQPGVAPGPPAVFGDAAFSSRPAAAAGDGSRGGGDAFLAGLLRGERTRFEPLPGTGVEARAVSGLLGPDTRTFTGADASAANLFALRSPRVLHLATHGFFLGGPTLRERLPNPLLRVGLALSGAQASLGSEEGHGLLSALQLAGLSLQGTELVVLSACETGLGDAVAGEGVAGLNGAFLTAGPGGWC